MNKGAQGAEKTLPAGRLRRWLGGGRTVEVYLRLLGYVRPYWLHLLAAMLCMAAYSALNGSMALLLRPVVDRVFMARDERLLFILPLVVVLLALGKGMADYGQSYLMANVGQKVIRDLRDALYQHMQVLSLSFFNRHSTGVLISRITNDVGLVQGSVTKAVTGLLKDSLTIVALVAVAFYNDWLLAILALCVFPWAVIPLVRFGRKIKRYSKRSQQQMGSITTLLHETISTQPIIKAFCMEEWEGRRFSQENRALFRTMMKRVKIRALSSPVMETLGGIGAAIAIFIGGYRVMEGGMTPGSFFSFIAAMGMLYEPVKRLNRLNLVLQEGMAASERIFQILDEEPEVKEAPGARRLPPFRESILFRGVSFGYEKGFVLKDVDLEIRKGEVVALVGESGAGKTTLAHLLPRFFDVSEGAILIDGVDIRDVTLRSLREQIAIVTQMSMLFNDTIFNNIAYGRPGASFEDVERAAKAAFAHQFIEALPMGYETVIGEAGVRLSGGQRQRICIARALLKDAPILILDEATSALDAKSEEEVQRSLEVLMRGRTVLVIAHRLSTVRDADRIVVLKKGRIVEVGRHDELLKVAGEYSRLYMTQKEERPEKDATEGLAGLR
jgi:subfamily B ATP-binding cassette protein MsbA